MKKPCLENAPGCKKVFEVINLRCVCCENPGCKDKRRKRLSVEWRAKNKDTRRKYFKNYWIRYCKKKPEDTDCGLLTISDC